MASSGVNKAVALYREGRSIPQASKALGIPKSTVRRWLANEGVLRSRADGVRLAANDGRIGPENRGKSRMFSDDHKKAISQSKLESGAQNARGWRITQSGYVEYTRGPNKGRGEHRVVMERMVGRKLDSCEEVHHIDGNRANNDPSNLELLNSKSEHMSIHAKERSKFRKRDHSGRFI